MRGLNKSLYRAKRRTGHGQKPARSGGWINSGEFFAFQAGDERYNDATCNREITFGSERRPPVKRMLFLMVLLMVVALFAGCKTATQATSRQMQYMADDTIRATGLDQASGLHRRDTEPWDTYEPYRGYP
jgi:hypothetical protein